MARRQFSTEVDDLEHAIRRRNVICSKRLLAALRLNHEVVIEPEPEPALEPEPLILELPDPAVFSGMNKIEQIKRIICKRYGISKEAIESNCRKKDIVMPRQIAMYLARKNTTYSFPEIGRRLGGRDHTTIIFAVRKIERMAGDDANFSSQLAEIQAEISV